VWELRNWVFVGACLGIDKENAEARVFKMGAYKSRKGVVYKVYEISYL
jgi:hypothetical protein